MIFPFAVFALGCIVWSLGFLHWKIEGVLVGTLLMLVGIGGVAFVALAT